MIDCANYILKCACRESEGERKNGKNWPSGSSNVFQGKQNSRKCNLGGDVYEFTCGWGGKRKKAKRWFFCFERFSLSLRKRGGKTGGGGGGLEMRRRRESGA